MEQPTTYAVIIGVLIAVAAFILNEFIRWYFVGLNFRRRLVVDIAAIVDSFECWQPPPKLDSNLTVCAIWDYGHNSLGDVYSHSSSLTPELFVSVTSLYSSCGQFDKIRCSYNETIPEIIRASDKEACLEAWLEVLNARLKELEKERNKIVARGNELLKAMRKHYWFANQLDELIAQSHESQASE